MTLLFIMEIICIHESEDWNSVGWNIFADGPVPPSASKASAKLDMLSFRSI
jgi:hypothetical protein